MHMFKKCDFCQIKWNMNFYFNKNLIIILSDTKNYTKTAKLSKLIEK